MSELAVDQTESLPPVVQFAPPDIARRRFATWNGIQTDAVVRRARFEYDFRAPVICWSCANVRSATKARLSLKACRNRPCTSSAAQ